MAARSLLAACHMRNLHQNRPHGRNVRDPRSLTASDAPHTTRPAMHPPATLVEALYRLPDGEARGFRFIGLDKKARYYPYAAMRAEAEKRAAFLSAAGLKKGDRV